MKTFNQVVEEEVTKYVEDYAQAITDVGGFGLAKHIKDHLTQAMNKAALAVVEELLEKTYMAEFTPYDVARAVRAEDIETIRKQLTDKE